MPMELVYADTVFSGLWKLKPSKHNPAAAFSEGHSGALVPAEKLPYIAHVVIFKIQQTSHKGNAKCFGFQIMLQ